MTRMLACVADSDDARTAAAAGIDIVEVRLRALLPGAAFDPGTMRAIRAAFPGALRLRVDHGYEPDAIEAAVSFGADEIAVPPEMIEEAAAILDRLRPRGRLIALVATLRADACDVLPALPSVRAVAFDVPDTIRLIDAVAIDQLDALAHACRAANLPFGLAGGLEAPDVARLLLLRPDVLGFDMALRRDHRRDGAFDPAAVAAIRALVPGDGRRASEPVGAGEQTDRVFVHDFIALLSIGAYQAERGVRQRVRFSVDADVVAAKQPADMSGVFSYDIIIETIRVLAARTHVTFVETLAEELAASLLTHAELRAVEVKVEKLDVIEGSVGIVVRRDRRNPPLA